MIHDVRRRPFFVSVGYGAALAMVMVWLLKFGLTSMVSNADGSLPERSVDVVVPLAGSPDRIAYAEALVGRRIAPNLRSTLLDVSCVRMGAPRRACVTGVRNTIDEALFLRRAFAEEGFTRAIIVTSPYHLARATAVFCIIFAGSDIDVHVVEIPEGISSADHITREVRSYLPSVGAAALARIAPAVYEWSVRSFWPRRCEKDDHRPRA